MTLAETCGTLPPDECGSPPRGWVLALPKTSQQPSGWTSPTVCSRCWGESTSSRSPRRVHWKPTATPFLGAKQLSVVIKALALPRESAFCTCVNLMPPASATPRSAAAPTPAHLSLCARSNATRPRRWYASGPRVALGTIRSLMPEKPFGLVSRRGRIADAPGSQLQPP